MAEEWYEVKSMEMCGCERSSVAVWREKTEEFEE